MMALRGADMLDGRDWYRGPAASPDTLSELRKVAPPGLPESYIGLLEFSDGGEGPLPVTPYNLCLDPARTVIEGIHGRSPDYVGFLIFGGNGGGEYLAFDLRGAAPWPIVAVDMIAGPESAELVAPDFDAFLDLVGTESAE